MSPGAACPDPARLKSLLDGTLPECERPLLSEHLETCGRCQRAVERLAAADTFWSGAARHLGQEQAGDEEALRQTVAALEAAASGPRAPLDELHPAEDPGLDFLDPPGQAGHLGRLAHYEVIELIGRGGMGIVFQALDEKLHRVVALKVLSPLLARNPAARERFVREAQAAAAVRDEHVVTIHAVEEANGLPYLVMEFIAGESLQQRLARRGPLDLKQILRIGMQAAAGLAAAHAQGLIHRDVKPGNILLENHVERVKITDFGLARAVDDAGASQHGMLAGTPQYMAPEQARGGPIDQRVDLFSLGSVLYAMCTGRPPFADGDTPTVLRRLCDEVPRSVRDLNPDIPSWMEAILARLLAKDPADRFPTAAEAAERLGRHLADLERGAAEPTPTSEHSRGPDQRWLPLRSPPAAAGALLVASMLLLAGWWLGRDGRGARPTERTAIPALPAANSPKTPAPQKLAGAATRLASNPGRAARVLFVIASNDFSFPEYISVESLLSEAGVQVVVASSSREEAQPDPRGPGQSVQPDVTLAEARGGDYDAVIFCGGRGAEAYVGNAEARRLITEAQSADRLVTALGMGPVILADAGILRGVRATCYKYGEHPGTYVARLKDAGAVWVDEPVVVSGRIITGRDPKDAKKFGRGVLDHLTRMP